MLRSNVAWPINLRLAFAIVFAMPACKIEPGFTKTVPDSVFVPDRVIVPPPSSSKKLVGPPEITPENVVVVGFAVMSCPEGPSVTLPAPANEPIVSLKLFTSSVAPLATVTSEVGLNTELAPALKVPALTVVGPL